METSRGTFSPAWLIGAPLLGVLFGSVANRLFPEAIQWLALLIYGLSTSGEVPTALPQRTLGILSALIGILLAVAVVTTWHVARHAMRASKKTVRGEA